MEFTLCYFHLDPSSCSFNHLITFIEFHTAISHKKRGLPPPTLAKLRDKDKGSKTSIRLLNIYKRLT